MKALTVWQPWAWAVVAGHKDIENRTWRPRGLPVGAWFAIHAGHGGSVADYAYAEWYLREKYGVETPLALPVGAVVGACMLGDILPPRAETVGWHEGGCIGWFLARAIEFSRPFFGVTGHQGLWELPAVIATRIKYEIDMCLAAETVLQVERSKERHGTTES